MKLGVARILVSQTWTTFIYAMSSFCTPPSSTAHAWVLSYITIYIKYIMVFKYTF